MRGIKSIDTLMRRRRDMSKLLVIEDDNELLDNLSDLLGDNGYLIDTARDFVGATGFLETYEYDLLIVDWNLPDGSGIDLVRRYRRANKTGSILILTGRSDIDSKELGLDCGADDFLSKPFVSREFLARVRALLRRSAGSVTQKLKAGNVLIDLDEKSVRVAGQPLEMQKLEYDVLSILVRNRGRILSQDELLARAWDSETEASVEALRTLIYKIRKKIETDNSKCRIVTAFRQGYRLETDDEDQVES